MALKLAGEAGVGESLEQLVYSPGLPNSGDLEPATRTITAVAKPALADYTTSLTIVAPADPRIQVLRAGLRLGVTIDSFGGVPAATRLNYAVEVNGVQRLTGFWTAVGAQFAVMDLTPGQFNLGTANSIGVFLWVDQGNAVVSLCQVWLGVGSTGTTPRTVATVSHNGFMAFYVQVSGAGTGFPTITVGQQGQSTPSELAFMITKAEGWNTTAKENSLVTAAGIAIDFYGAVATDLSALLACSFILRRQE